jgi:DNA processing protein
MNTSAQVGFFENQDDVIRPTWEISAYESLWEKYPSVKKIAELFQSHNYELPSNIAKLVGIVDEKIEQIKNTINGLMPFKSYSAIFHKDFEYPERLRLAEYPLEVLYYRGALDLLSSRIVSVVGARQASPEGIKRAKKVASLLVENKFTVMSGLAEGIDSAAHQATIENGGKTIAVLGTALNEVYPKNNKTLQEEIAKEYLVLSQVPFYVNSLSTFWKYKRNFFPARNVTMAALSAATVIVEASDTSGSLIQARAAIKQGKKLFILKSCFDKGLNWPETYLKKGAIKITDDKQLVDELQSLN